MPCETDLYFTVEDNRREVACMPIRKSSSDEKPILRQISSRSNAWLSPQPHRPGPSPGSRASAGGKPAVLPNRIGGQRRLDAFEKNEIVGRGLGRTADRCDPLNPVGEQCGPMERLLRPHREAVNQRDPLDAEHLRQQPLLHPDIVGRREMRVTAAVERRRVAGRG